MSISGIRGANCIPCPQLKKEKQKNILNINEHIKKMVTTEYVSSKDHMTLSQHLQNMSTYIIVIVTTVAPPYHVKQICSFGYGECFYMKFITFLTDCKNKTDLALSTL